MPVARHLFFDRCPTTRSLRRTLLRVGVAMLLTGCASIRTTDPPRTATEQFLLSVSIGKALDQLRLDTLRDRQVFLSSEFISQAKETNSEVLFTLGELRARLLLAGARLVEKRDDAQIVMEVRTGGIGIDRTEFLLGIPAILLPGAASGGLPVATPELAIVKSTKQYGFSGIAYVAYWRDTGEIVASSGPYIGRTLREDWWFFGWGPRTIGNIPPAQR